MADSGILMVTPWIRTGGTERGLEIAAPWFVSRGHRVKVLSWEILEEISGNPNPHLKKLRQAGIPVERLRGYGRFTLLQRAVRVASIALTQRFPVIVGRELDGNIVAIMAKLLLAGRRRVFARVHSSSSIYSALKFSRSKLRLAAALLPRADGIVAVSESVRQDAIRFFNLDPSSVAMIYNAVQIAEIQSQSRAVEDPEIENIGPYIFGCGRFTEMKGFPDLICAFSLIAAEDDMKELKLVIVGDGPDRQKLLECADRYGVSGRVLFPGHKANPHPYFARAKAFVLSSRFGEAFARVLVEAMVCGTPIISSRCEWGPEEVLQGGKCGLLYDVGDVKGLADGLLRILRHPEEAAERAKTATKRAEDFAESTIMPKVERYYGLS